MLPYVIGSLQELSKENKVLKRTVEELNEENKFLKRTIEELIRRIEVLEKKEGVE